MAKFYQNGWFQKVLALGIASAYFILLIFINNSSYVWATLALVFILFVTTFTCSSSSTDSPLLIPLRRNRQQSSPPGDRPTSGGDLSQTDGCLPTGVVGSESRIWVSDIPPSYSFVMRAEELPPPTPPPSYGSALLLFPPPYVAAGVFDKESPESPAGTPFRARRLFRPPLSISTQVSVTGSSAPDSPLPPEGSRSRTPSGGYILSTRISLSGGDQSLREEEGGLSFRTRLFLTRQMPQQPGDPQQPPDQPPPPGDLLPPSSPAENSQGQLQLSTQLILSRQKTPSPPAEEAAEPATAIDLHSCQIPIILVTEEALTISEEQTEDKTGD